MFDQIWTDLSGSVETVVKSKDYILLGVMAVVAIAMGFTMPKWTSLFGRAGQGLLLVALFLFLWDALDNETKFAWSNWDSEGKESWVELMAMTVKTLLGYYAVMLVGVGVVFGVKSVVNR